MRATRSRSCAAAAAWIAPGVALTALAGLVIGGCQPPPPADEDTLPANPTPDLDDVEKRVTWSAAFDASGVGALSAVWGSSPDDVFIVGGTPTGGEVYHYDGATWRQMHIPNVPLLVWVFGFGPDDVYAVGLDGGAIRFDGSGWTTLDAGTDQDLWGVWGRSAQDLWIVGGDVGRDEPVLIHFDGKTFTPKSVPPNDRDATSLFKIWGTQTKLFAVGENGLIIEYDGSRWTQVPAGADADEDFVALWGSDDTNIVAVGGRTGARIAVYDGQSWSTQKFTGMPGLNGVFMTSPSECIVGGVNGYVGKFNPVTNLLTVEADDDRLDIHAVWGDGQGRYYGVGGRFRTPFEGIALVRTSGAPGFTPAPPIPVTAITDCNGNGIDDADDIASGDSNDCDGDGQPDECQIDTDSDGLIDACDECPDDPEKFQPGDCGCGTPDTDSDNDGVPDCIDICPGMDDLSDPEKFDPGICGCGLTDEGECDLGENYIDGSCQPTSDPDLELGVGGETRIYARLCNGSEWANVIGIQGFIEFEFSLRASGFPPNARVELQFNLRHADGRNIRSRTSDVTRTESESGINVLYERREFLTNAALCELCNQEVILNIQITDSADPTIRAVSERRLLLVLVDPFGDFDCERDCP